MWVPGSIAFLAAGVRDRIEMLYGNARPERTRSRGSFAAGCPCCSIVPHGCRAARAGDRESVPGICSRCPALGDFLRRRWARPALQLGMLVLAALVIARRSDRAQTWARRTWRASLPGFIGAGW